MKTIINLIILICYLFIFSRSLFTQPVHRVLFEIQTSTQCEVCGINGIPLVKQILESYNGNVICISYYLNNKNEIFQIPECDTVSVLTQYEKPSASTDRILNSGKFLGHIFVESHNWDTIVKAALNLPAPVEVKLTCEINKGTRELSALIEGTFYESLNGDIRFNVLITEDKIIYPQAGASDEFIHNNILRKMLGGFWGTAGVIPNNVNPSDSFSYQYNYTLDTNWNIDNLNFIGLVQQGETNDMKEMRIYNSIRGDVITSIKESEKVVLPIMLKLLPNPGSDNIKIQFNSEITTDFVLEIYNMLGEKLGNIFKGTTNIGTNEINYDTGNLSSGVYLIKMQAGQDFNCNIVHIIK